MERWNSEAIPRDRLKHALRRPDVVAHARRIDRCLLCFSHHVDEAGLCSACHAFLDPEELALAEKWRSGVGP